MSIDPHQLEHVEAGGVHAIAFHLDDGGRANQEFVRRFFAGEFLAATAAMNVLVVDLSGVVSLDSSALGPLVQKLRDVQERGGGMALAGVQAPALREIFALTRFDKVFRIYPNRDEAVKALAGKAK